MSQILKCWSCKAEYSEENRLDCDGHCWKCGVEIENEDAPDATNFIACNVDESCGQGTVPPAGGEEAPEVFSFKGDDAGPYEFVLAHEYRAHVTRLKGENAALQKSLTFAVQRLDDLQHDRAQCLEVNPTSLRSLLTALVGAPHEIRELQACRGIPDNPIDQLLREYNAWVETPAAAATPQ